MKLHEMLNICLLALDSRYPESVVEINETVLGHQSLWAEICAPVEMLDLLENHALQLLHVPACLVIDGGQSAIYLVEQSQEVPAFWVYCEGHIPAEGFSMKVDNLHRQAKGYRSYNLLPN